ncbi:MAG TPA: sulfite exporter TauE/SafE family protein [Bryobacteraceae bacterium]|nr:sulfite exporter TauE/SafE family protein [Bryobacteraceae bacterium]
MEFLLGFLIACAVGLTGVGAGSITAPVLILFFHLKPTLAVGTALAFSAAIKFVVVPLYIRRHQVDYRILGLLCLGGIPGVLFGARVLSQLNTRNHEGGIFLLLGTTIFVVSIGSLYRTLRNRLTTATVDRARWLPPIAVLIGGEVGFSSAGAGALGALVLLNLTKLTPAQVVGTDMVFGFILSLIGGGLHLLGGQYNWMILIKLVSGGVVGSLCGAALSSVIPPRPLRLALSVWLAILGLQLCWKALS